MQKEKKMKITLKELEFEDCIEITAAFLNQGWDKPLSQYQNYYRESVEKKRTVFLAYFENKFAGYLTIKWDAFYPYFKENKIPEISDLNVLKIYQRNGIASKLMDKAEQAISERSNIAGIGVGLTKDYGPAQIMYVKRGYIPDGLGLSYNERLISYGENVRVDDDLIICLTKQLK